MNPASGAMAPSGGSPLTYIGLHALIGGGLGHSDVACPKCGPDCRSPANRSRRVLRVWREQRGVFTFKCARCDAAGKVTSHEEIAEDAAGGTRVKPPSAATDAERTARAMRLWEQAKHPTETPVEAYLAFRGLQVPSEAAGEAIRWHPYCPFGKGVRAGCMLALVRDFRSDAPLAIHRTALTADGRKAVLNGASRLSFGPIGGGAVKLTPDADVTLGLGVGEGIETVLSLRRLPGCEALAIWALLAANQMSAFPVLPGLEGLWIAVDHDPTGLAAARTLRERWQDDGVDVVTARPTTDGADLNDIASTRNAQ